MKEITITFLLSLVCVSFMAQSQSDERGYLVKVGEMAPDFEMQLTDGSKIKLSDLKGQVVMLQFTASWCGVCRKEMPHIEKRIWQAYNDKGLKLYGIDRDEPLKKALQLKNETGVTYPMGLDPKARIFKLYADKHAGVTRNVLINREGRIIFLTRLYNQDEFDALVKKIREEME